jgi:hypothetical protein
VLRPWQVSAPVPPPRARLGGPVMGTRSALSQLSPRVESGGWREAHREDGGVALPPERAQHHAPRLRCARPLHCACAYHPAASLSARSRDVVSWSVVVWAPVEAHAARRGSRGENAIVNGLPSVVFGVAGETRFQARSREVGRKHTELAPHGAHAAVVVLLPREHTLVGVVAVRGDALRRRLLSVRRRVRMPAGPSIPRRRS